MPDDVGSTRGAGSEADLIARYEQIAQASHEMVAAARHGDWDSVTRLEEACRALIAQIRLHRIQVRLSPTQQRRRMALLRSILADDAEVRDRSEPWLRQLEQVLRSAGVAPRHPPGD
jgi:flagellar protein FliT